MSRPHVFPITAVKKRRTKRCHRVLSWTLYTSFPSSLPLGWQKSPSGLPGSPAFLREDSCSLLERSTFQAALRPSRKAPNAHTVRPPVVCLKSRGLFKSVQPPHGISCALWSPLFFDSAFQLSASFHRAAQQSLCNQVFSPSGTRKVLAGLQQEGNPFG